VVIIGVSVVSLIVVSSLTPDGVLTILRTSVVASVEVDCVVDTEVAKLVVDSKETE